MTPAIAQPRTRRIEPPHRQSGYRLRRFSRVEEGTRPGATLSWPRATARMKAIERWERRQKKDPRKRNRAVGHVGVELYKYLCRRRASGKRLDNIAYGTIAGILGFARSAIVAAAARLRHFGWLIWVRTWRDTGEEGLRGPQVEQGINAYEICAPTAKLEAMGIAVEPPDPDDDATRRKAEEAQRKAARVDDSVLGEVLRRTAHLAEERESS
jgi:hypothetical protein